MIAIPSVICLIACHGGAADHFATFAERLIKEGHQVEVYASGPALKKFQERNITVVCPFNVDHLSSTQEKILAEQIVKYCNKASVVLTDVGHDFDVALQKSFTDKAPEVLRIAYYDNPESYVPGGYSHIAAQVMRLAHKVLFANAHLKEEVLYKDSHEKLLLPFNRRVGLGYYPLSQAEKVAARRAKGQEGLRAQFFSQNQLEEKGQKVLVYFGGNNQEYFGKAFPAFLTLLSDSSATTDLSNTIVVLQQHPGAKSENLDRQAMEKWINELGNFEKAPKIILSNQTSEEMQVIADAALYYQTSMGPLFALAGIPTIQVGHEVYEDVLIKNGLCASVLDAAAFVDAVSSIKPVCVSEEHKKKISDRLGIKEDWFHTLKQTFNLVSC